jgi:hypothetical protein
VDCNGNGQRDACELENGTAVDLNYDGIPDSCQQQCSNPDSGDGNGDAACNGKDIKPFVTAVMAGSTAAADVCVFDFSNNNAVGPEMQDDHGC